MDTDQLLLIAIGAFVAWLLYVIWQYTGIRSRMSITEQNQFIFGKFHRVKNPAFVFSIVPRAGSAWGLFAFAAISILIALIAKWFFE